MITMFWGGTFLAVQYVKEHQKQVVKVASIAGGTLKTILSALPKLAKKGEKTVTAAAIASAVLIVCR